MLAFAWPWGPESSSADPVDARRLVDARQLGAALCAGIGGHAAFDDTAGLHCAYRQMRWTGADARAWQPARTVQGHIALFHGFFDNAAEIAGLLGLPPEDPATLYAAAVAAWGEDADRRIIGEYCAVVADPARRTVRLSRSPLKAPPLVYAHHAGMVAAASVARALFAAGIERKPDLTRAIDSAMHNVTDHEQSWFEGVRRVPLGSIVTLSGEREAPDVNRWYRLGEVQQVRLPSAQAYVERTAELLDEAVRVCMSGAQRPGSTLSAGLDSPQVAIRALAALPEGRRLPTFTFHPEDGWDGIEAPGTLGNERPFVEAMAAMYPALEPHFVDNAGVGHDHRWNDMFLLMDGNCGTLSLTYMLHGIFERARTVGCDRLLLAEWGNQTFSERGDWAYVEYLLTGRWRQLWLALTVAAKDSRSVLRRFIALSLVPLLPNRMWRWLMKLWHRGDETIIDMMIPLRDDFREASGADARLKANQILYDRFQPRTRRENTKLTFAMFDIDTSEAFQAFQLMYDMPCRDPMAYRPFVEFCLGLPTDLLMRDGVERWLAKELATGMVPAEQAENRRNGRWDADWLLRMKRNREVYEAELDRIEDDEELSQMIDVPRLRAALDALPDSTPTDVQAYTTVRHAMIGGVQTARFIRFINGRN